MDAIFTFHSIDSSGSVLSYSPDDLRRLIAGLGEEGVSIVSLAELLQQDSRGQDRAALTFDDGFDSVHRNALSILADSQTPATVYVVAEWVGKQSRWPTMPRGAPCFDLMSWSALADLSSTNVEIGCHTANHPPLARLSEEEWDLELRASRSRIEHELQVAVRHFAYPYGIHGKIAVDQVRALYESAVTTNLGFLAPTSDRHRLPRIETYYLQDAERHRPFYGIRTRCHLKLRGILRHLKSRVSAR
jgi:peptidoglycan/xylan/chitin deacetylase (PgdA/CDA1 family)